MSLIRLIFGVPCHTWSSEFFAFITSLTADYIYMDDNTSKHVSMDVARVLVRTKSVSFLNEIFNVDVNDTTYSIKMVEDFHRPITYPFQSTEKVVNHVSESDSSDDDDHHWNNENWADHVEEDEGSNFEGNNGDSGDEIGQTPPATQALGGDLSPTNY